MTYNLSELWKIGRQYGLVRLCTMDTGLYYACIEFATIDHTKLEASSDFKQLTPEAALTMAIKSAEAIVNSVSSLATGQSERKLLS